MTITNDRVGSEMIDYPRRWNIQAIRKFMITFGLVSSVFDYFTFGVLLLVLHANQDQFRTGWFLESVISASLIVLVIRSRKPFFESRPSQYLLVATLLVVVATLLLPLTPLHTAGEDSGATPTAHFVPPAHWDHCRGLHPLGRDDEADLLQQGESVKGPNKAKSLSVKLWRKQTAEDTVQRWKQILEITAARKALRPIAQRSSQLQLRVGQVIHAAALPIHCDEQ